jgi:hypothetical protein
MRRRVLLLTALAMVAAVGVIGGLAATAFGPEDGAPAKPSGKETRIRIEPQKDNVACSGDKQAVDVFLDDLRPRPNGLAAFQVTLVYDPSILRVEEPEDAQMNPALASAQTAGGMRAFMPAPTTIDNLEGYVFMGAVGIPQGEPFNAAAQGLDPVARGEPILLFTVNFQTVGEGTSPLTVYRGEEPSPKAGALGVQVVDYAGQEYTPVTITDSSLTVTAGKCAPAPAVTARPTQVLPTPPPTATPVVVPTPQEVTPVPAAQAGRPDCPAEWNVYADPNAHFSVCYPSGWAARTSRPNPQGAVAVTLSNLVPGAPVTGQSEGRVLISAWWQGPEARQGMIESQCRVFEGVWAVPVEKLTIQVAGASATACRAMGTSENVDQGTVELLVLDPVGGGVVEVFAHPSVADRLGAEAVMQEVLATLRVPAG